MKPIAISALKFGCLSIEGWVSPTVTQQIAWRCKCDCGFAGFVRLDWLLEEARKPKNCPKCRGSWEEVKIQPSGEPTQPTENPSWILRQSSNITFLFKKRIFEIPRSILVSGNWFWDSRKQEWVDADKESPVGGIKGIGGKTGYGPSDHRHGKSGGYPFQ